jgi:predicted TIM-barrel fold metal-dependent hydrolase
MEHPVDFIGGVERVSRADKERIMGGNAARLLKIDYNARTRRRKT